MPSITVPMTPAEGRCTTQVSMYLQPSYFLVRSKFCIFTVTYKQFLPCFSSPLIWQISPTRHFSITEKHCCVLSLWIFWQFILVRRFYFGTYCSLRGNDCCLQFLFLYFWIVISCQSIDLQESLSSSSQSTGLNSSMPRPVEQ